FMGSGPKRRHDRIARVGAPHRDAAPPPATSNRAGLEVGSLRRRMKIAVSSDLDTPLARKLVEELRARGHEPVVHGALAEDERNDWAWASERAARDVVSGTAQQGIVCCWTGTGASIAANKVPGVRAALCGDAE